MGDDINRWLEELGLGKYASLFNALPHLTQNDLQEFGLPIGPRKIVAAASANLAAPTLPTELAAADKSSGQPCKAERRQLTVMFCDLVNSTGLFAMERAGSGAELPCDRCLWYNSVQPGEAKWAFPGP